MKQAVISLVLLILFFCSLITKGEDTGTTVSVMTFNIRYDNPGDGDNVWANRKTKVVSMIKFYDVDIVGTQEVLKNQKNYLDEQLTEYTSVGVGRKDGVDEGEFNVVFFKTAKFELLGNGTFWLSETPDVVASVGWDAALERICIWVKLKDKSSGREFFIFNTHFDHMGEQARINSSKLLLSKMKNIVKDVPVILTGDFNITSDNEAYKVIVKDQNYKLYDSHLKSVLPHHGPTWTFHGFDQVDINERVKIDYIFVNDKVKVLKHGILSDRFDGGYPSDHLPVLIEAVIK